MGFLLIFALFSGRYYKIIKENFINNTKKTEGKILVK